MPEEKDYSRPIEHGKSDARTGTHRTTVSCSIDECSYPSLVVAVATIFIVPPSREMNSDEKAVYNAARSRELDRIAKE